MNYFVLCRLGLTRMYILMCHVVRKTIEEVGDQKKLDYKRQKRLFPFLRMIEWPYTVTNTLAATL